MASQRGIQRFLTHKKFRVFRMTLLTLLLISCAKKPDAQPPNSETRTPSMDTSQLEDTLNSGGGNPLDPGGDTVGSGTDGGLTEADQWALKNVFQEQSEVMPTDTSWLSDYLKQEAIRLLDEERRGKEVAVEKMVLAGKILESCAKKTGTYAPIPGQPLLGLWKTVTSKVTTNSNNNEKKASGEKSSSSSKCPVTFTVAGSGAAGSYTVTGGTKGTMKATNVGDGTLQTQPYTEGRLTDRPQAGTGTLTHPTFSQTKYGTDPCSANVALATSANPIPENYKTAMKNLGQCFRQAIVLLNPIFDKMFENMDPQLKQILMSKMLGIGGTSK